MSPSPLHVLVAGAGLGGLTLALALARGGARVTVLEQARALGEVGAGVQVSANRTRVPFALGLEPALAAVAFVPERGEIRHWRSGEVLRGPEQRRGLRLLLLPLPPRRSPRRPRPRARGRGPGLRAPRRPRHRLRAGRGAPRRPRVALRLRRDPGRGIGLRLKAVRAG